MNYDEKVKKILVAHDLDFTIEKIPLTGIYKGNEIISPYFGLMNSKTGGVINTCKAGYGVSQNAEIVEMILRGTENFGSKLRVVKAGSINGGRKVYIQLAIEGAGKVGDDVIERKITVIDSNDGSTSLCIGIGDLTMSCENQFYRFYKAGNAKFRHTATIEEKIKSIPYLIIKALDESMKQIDRYNTFLHTPATKEMAEQLIKYVLEHDKLSPADYANLGKRSVNAIDLLNEHMTKEISGKGLNLWGLHSGVTSYTTHETKGPKRTENNGLIESLLTGNAYQKNERSFSFVSQRAGLILS